jgi:hypothetical protein
MKMHQLIIKIWLVLAVAAALAAIYVSLTEGFVFGKAYMFLIISAAALLLYRFKKAPR